MRRRGGLRRPWLELALGCALVVPLGFVPSGRTALQPCGGRQRPPCRTSALALQGSACPGRGRLPGRGRTAAAARGGSGESVEAAPPVCASEEGRALEELLRDGLSASRKDLPGTYTITSSVAVVGPTKELSKPPHLATLSGGDEVEVLEVAVLEAEGRVRGRLAEPVGWISLENTQTGYRWAERAEALKAFDERLAKAFHDLGEEAAALGFSLEEELKDELLDRRQGDLLYLAAVRRQSKQGLPFLPSFEAPGQGAWAFSGGLDSDQLRKMAGQNARNVPLAPCTEPLRRELTRAVLGGAEYGSGLLRAFVVDNSGYFGGFSASPGSFGGFLRRLTETTRQVLVKVGGACGHPSQKRPTPESKAPKSGKWGQKEVREWLQLFATVSANTRVHQADSYFSNALFGVCLKRLVKRFNLDRSLGTLPELPEGAAEAAAGQGEAALAAVQFDAFVQDLAERPADEGSALEELLALSSSELLAARRRAEALFGRGLRDEMQVPMDRAADEVERLGNDATTPPMEVTASFLLEAASAGEVRMLTCGQEAKERMMWDAIAFGAFLQDATTALVMETR